MDGKERQKLEAMLVSPPWGLAHRPAHIPPGIMSMIGLNLAIGHVCTVWSMRHGFSQVKSWSGL